jgi:ATP-binding protein involved in chromosome partitioning
MKPPSINHSPVPHVRKIIAVGSGKGGVGKSTVTTCLAHALNAAGIRTGILDADIHGPSIAQMLGIATSGQPELKDELLLPIEGYGIPAMSMANLAPGAAAIWRGPMVTKALIQMLRFVRWGTEAKPLDVLLIDLPPGTGDIHLTLLQQAPIDGAIVITTPQEMSVIDAEKAAQLFAKTDIPVLGIIENMSWLELPDGSRQTIFGEGGGAKLAAKSGAPLLAQLPLNPALRAAMDEGKKPDVSAFADVVAALTSAA